jgi:hypothetical protein
LRHELRNQVHPDLGLPFNKEGTRLRSVVVKNDLCLDLIRYAQAVEHFADVHAADAAAGRIEIGLRRQEGLLESFWRGDV